MIAQITNTGEDLGENHFNFKITRERWWCVYIQWSAPNDRFYDGFNDMLMFRI
jgi:hypothetical protein